MVAACVMTFEARDSAAKVTPARPQTLPRPLPRRGPVCAAPARLDQLGVYRLPHVLPLPHSLPLAPIHRHRPPHVRYILITIISLTLLISSYEYLILPPNTL